MKFTERKQREIKLEKLLYQEYLRRTYIVYNCQHHHVTTRRETDFTYKKWRTQKFLTEKGTKEITKKKINEKLLKII